MDDSSVNNPSRRSSIGISVRSSSMDPPTKSILKKQSFINVHADIDRALAQRSTESPRRWFQRVLRQHELSPIDLCDRFSYGDTCKHRYVPLKHVCEQLFELDPGNDPLTDDMEEFLFKFALDQGDGEIVIDIKEALRTLDIWQTTSPMGPSPKKKGPSSPQPSISPAKATMLQVKAERMQQVVSSLQHENLRLSQALSDAGSNMTIDELRPPSPLKFAVRKLPQGPSSMATSIRSPPKPQPAVVTRHEQELVDLASRLEYSGVKKLEVCLQNSDAKATGFISLKQLRWILLNECGMEAPPPSSLSESRLMELCVGMNFNAQGLVEYKEFARVLLDILQYEAPRNNCHSAKTATPSLPDSVKSSLTTLREYLTGFYGSKEKTRELLEVLCDKYDLEGNQCISLQEFTRVLVSDLPTQHPVHLNLPLTRSATSDLLKALADVSAQRLSRANDSEFVYYPSVLDTVFCESDGRRSSASPSRSAALASTLIQREFWQGLRSALCPPTERHGFARKIHAQLCKILMKLDPKHTFWITQRHFMRVFDQHWSAKDLERLVLALSDPVGTQSPPPASVCVRYDVLMKLLFNAPDLRDASALSAIMAKIQRQQKMDWQRELSGQKTLSYRRVYEVLSAETTLTLTEFLYMVAHCKTDTDDRVDTKSLARWLCEDTDASVGGDRATDRSMHSVMPSSAYEDEGFTVLRQCLRVLCDDFDLENGMHRLAKHARGVVAIDALARELVVQLRTLQLSASDQRRVVNAHQVAAFLRSIGGEPTSDSLYLHSVMDALFDWDAICEALWLPDRLSEVKQTLELFDWHKNGAIELADWAKAWRQLTTKSGAKSNRSVPSSLRDWELRVLVHRFPVPKTETSSPKSIDYSRLLVFLIERQQRLAREQLRKAVTLLLKRACDRVTQGTTHWTIMHLEKVFALIDHEGKGYFHVGDLREFVVNELRQMQDANTTTLLTYASQGPAMEAVMKELVGSKHKDRSPAVVSLMRFQELVNHGFQPQDRADKSQRPSHQHSRCAGSQDEEELLTDDSEARRWSGESRMPSDCTQITLLNDLERCVYEIAQQFADSEGHVSPTAAYAHFNDDQQPARSRVHQQSKTRPHSQSPVRQSTSSWLGTRRASYSPIQQHTTMEPLTATRLKQTLRQRHGIETSTHLIGQFFLHLGATTRHFLELPSFAHWLTPLPVDFQRRVKQIVKDMMVKSKSGGGQVDLERFLSALARRLAEAHATEAAMVRSTPTKNSHSWRHETRHELVCVSPTLLLSRLHQLNVPLRKPELWLLLRHFGMDDEPEIDYAAFIRRLYELAQRL